MNATTRAAEGLLRRRWSVAEIQEIVKVGILAADERFELIGGEVVPMSPKGLKHERLRQALEKHWFRVLPDDFDMVTETTFRLDADTFVEPDFVFVRSADGFAGVTPESALLAVEVADSSLSFDLGRKTEVYAAHGLKEVWVIDAETFETHVFAAPDEGGYRDRRTIGRKAALAFPFAPRISVILDNLKLMRL